MPNDDTPLGQRPSYVPTRALVQAIIDAKRTFGRNDTPPPEPIKDDESEQES